MIMIVRHAEKPTDVVAGVRPSGEPDKHSLSVRGWTRAGALLGLFAPQDGEPRTGLARPDRIYATSHAHDSSQRPVQTVTPLAERLGVDVHDDRGIGDEPALAAELAGYDGPVLVAWHHEAIPTLVRAFGTVTPAAPESWPDERFDVVWTLSRAASGWQFAQVPQLVLAGDRPEPIG